MKFTYKDKTIEELKQLSVREFAKLLPSRQKRFLLRKSQEVEKFLVRAEKKLKKGKQIKTHNRDIVIVPALIDLTIYVHNGKDFVPVKIAPEMLGHRLGEFVLTRKKVIHRAPGIGATRSSAAWAVK